MSTLKLKPGQIRGYFSRTNPDDGKNAARRGKVLSVEVKKTGTWVTLMDRETKAQIAVRPSQVVA